MNQAPARLRRALQLFEDALEHPAASRDAWLAQACAGDADLLAHVRAMLAADTDARPDPITPKLAALRDDPADPAELPAGTRIGPWEVQGVLGRGGMGAVYRVARADGGYEHEAALKRIRIGLDGATARQRFLRERQILARLQHPHIAGLLDGGVDEHDAPYFVMPRVEGERIDRWCDARGLDVRARVRLLLQVLDAVAFAHRQLVVHRDLKPSNIMVDAAGHAFLLDFGIAKLMEEEDDGGQTRTGERAFTPEYASPEQLHGEPVSTATDLYQLGVLLYALLAQAHPYGLTGDTPLRARLARMDGDPRPLWQAALQSSADDAARRGTTPAALARQLRGDLSAIAGRCLAADPARRYGSVDALREDLHAWLDGKPVAARAPTAHYRVGRFIRRNKLAVGAAAAVAVALFTGLGIALWQAHEARLQAQRAERESARATALAGSLQRERDAALDEVRRQELLREHFTVVLNRVAEGGAAITPERLMELAADPNLLGRFGDARMQTAMQLALSDLLMQSGDYPRALALLEELEPTLAPDDGRAIAWAGVNRATAEVRLGRIDEAEATVARAEQSMTAEQRSGGLVPSNLEMLRNQIHRARGDLAAARASAARASELALHARDGSALAHGTLIGSGATAMLMLGDLDAAIALADQADTVWREAGVSNNVFANTVTTQRGNALLLRGNLLAARKVFDAIDAGGAADSVPAHAARDASRAKLLALLAEPAAAQALADDAVRRLCTALGQDSLDCLRMRLGRVDTLQLAGRVAAARAELAGLAPALQAQPPLRAAADNFAAVLELRAKPSEAALAAVLARVPASAKAGALPRRNAVRALLLLAEAMQADGHAGFAERLARSAIDTAGTDGAGGAGAGMDASLLALWRARLEGGPPPSQAREALVAAIGAGHPLVAAHAP